ncbi:MAG: hypothetical protein AB1774_10005 [Bacillota bacterium]
MRKDLFPAILLTAIAVFGASLVVLAAARVEGDAVLFSFRPPPGARTVTLAGTFNGWSTTATPLEDYDGDGVWSVRLPLAPGRYEYKFVVNGSKWFTDEDAASFAPDGFGGRNSVIAVGTASSALAMRETVDQKAQEAPDSDSAGEGVPGDGGVPEQPPERRIEVVFVFHLNQNVVPLADVANDVTYVGLLRVLRRHAPTKFVIHVSGTLLEALQWRSREALQLIRDGIREGQFEILGSTFAQNVMYSAGDMWYNQVQVELHRDIVARVLGVQPVGFWNPERVWDPSFIPFLAGNGYRYTLVEAPIIGGSGVDKERIRGVHRVEESGRSLDIFADQIDFRNTVNARNPATALAFLKVMYRKDVDDKYVIVYAEDAEATGLWTFEKGGNPSEAWEGMDAVISRLKRENWIEFTTFSDHLAKMAEPPPTISIRKGHADWMLSPSVRQGFKDWFDYNDNSPELQKMRDLYGAVRKRIQDAEAVIGSAPSQAAARLLRQARHSLAVAQYEFGAVGAGWPGVAMWELARVGMVSALAAEQSVRRKVGAWQEDVNGDGIVEVLLSNGRSLFILTPVGGKLLYWFDLESGNELVGSENATYYLETFVNESSYVPALRHKDPLWPWLERSPFLPDLGEREYVVRRRGLNDILVGKTGGRELALVDLDYEAVLNDDEVVLKARREGLVIEKAFRLEGDGIRVAYRFFLPEEQERAGDNGEVRLPADVSGLELLVENGFSPSYYPVVLEAGGDALAVSIDGDRSRTLVWNRLTGLGIQLVTSTPPLRVDTPRRMMFGREINLRFPLPVNQRLELTLYPVKVSLPPKLLLGWKEEGDTVFIRVPSYIREAALVENGETTREFALAHDSGGWWKAKRTGPVDAQYALELRDIYGGVYMLGFSQSRKIAGVSEKPGGATGDF